MSFQNSWVLWGLIALSIPIIIHLFNFRKYKTIYFSQVQFLKNIQEQTASTNKLKHLLLLAMRLLAFACLIFAFAQPFIPSSDKNNEVGIVSVYLDNSYSMQSNGKGTNLLEEGKRFSEDLANAYSSKHKFHLITNDFEGKHQHLLNRDQFIDYVHQVKYSSKIKSLEGVKKRQDDLLKQENSGKSYYYLSDFQKNTSKPQLFSKIKDEAVFFVPINAEINNNVSIDSCWVDMPFYTVDENNTLFAKVYNHSKKPTSVTMKLNVDGVQKAIQTVGIEADTFAIAPINFSVKKGGWHKGILSVNDHPIMFDNQCFFSFQVAEALKVLSIFEENNKNIDAIFENDSAFYYSKTSVNNINYNTLQQNNCIILNGVSKLTSGLSSSLEQFVKQGGSLVVLPSINMDLQSFNTLLNALSIGGYNGLKQFSGRISQLNYQHPVLSGVFERIPKDNIDLPTVKAFFPINNDNFEGLPIMSLSNGQAFLKNYSNSGNVYLSTVGISEKFSNFSMHALFVPLLYKMGLQSGRFNNLYYHLNTTTNIPIVSDFQIGNEEVLHLISEDKKNDIIPERIENNGVSSIYLHNEISESGNYTLMYNNELIQYVSLNHAKEESSLDCFTFEELKTIGNQAKITTLDLQNTNLNQEIKNIREGFALWKCFIIAALVFLLLEQIIVRLWK